MLQELLNEEKELNKSRPKKILQKKNAHTHTTVQ